MYLIELLKFVYLGFGSELPSVVTKEDYDKVSKNRENNKALTGFVGYGCSFGGKFFGGYARNSRGYNYAMAAKSTLIKDFEKIKNIPVVFSSTDYHNVEIPKGAIIYADPPYANTTGYLGTTFNTDEFWDCMRVLSKDHLVFISEQEAPEDFVSIWERDVMRTLSVDKAANFKKTEHLFVYRDNLKLL